MAAKVIINCDANLSPEGVLAKRQQVADALGVRLDDVVFVPGVTISVVEVPDPPVSKCALVDLQPECEE